MHDILVDFCGTANIFMRKIDAIAITLCVTCDDCVCVGVLVCVGVCWVWCVCVFRGVGMGVGMGVGACMLYDNEYLYEKLWLSINWLRIRTNAC